MNWIVALLLAQQAATGTLRVTVIDQTNAVVIGATVTAAGSEESTKHTTPAPVKT